MHHSPTTNNQGKGQPMIQHIFAVTVKELKVLWHDREALALLFIMPVFFILVMSLSLEGVYGAGSREHPLEILAVNEDQGQTAGKVILDLGKMERLAVVESLEGAPVTLKKAQNLIKTKKYRLALHFGGQFSERIQSDSDDHTIEVPVISLMVDPAMNLQLVSSLRGTIQGVVERHLFMARLPHLMQQGLSSLGELGPPEMAQTLNALTPQLENIFSNADTDSLHSGTFSLQVVPLRSLENDRQPTSTEQNVPGYTIFGVFFIVLTLASSFIQEKNDGTFQRILTAPLSKAALIVGKLLPYYLVNLVQIALMFAVGVVFFDLRLGNIGALFLVSLALSASANGLGLLVAAVGKTEAQVNGLAVLLAITLSALGGMMVPVFLMPGFMKTMSLFTPHAWALSGYHDVMIRGLGVSAVLGEAGVLLGFSVLFFLIALWRFRFE
jgi:ABC-2 type transport system permease protein